MTCSHKPSISSCLLPVFLLLAVVVLCLSLFDHSITLPSLAQGHRKRSWVRTKHTNNSIWNYLTNQCIKISALNLQELLTEDLHFILPFASLSIVSSGSFVSSLIRSIYHFDDHSEDSQLAKSFLYEWVI